MNLTRALIGKLEYQVNGGAGSRLFQALIN
jgi:hypothetical protein